MSKSKDYEIICKIGQGSFGTVYKVKRKSDKQILVMKMIKIPTLSKKHQQESLHEVTILSSLNNPYIVKYYESFVENSTLHIIMEYCEKGDLSQVLKKQPLSEGKIWKFFIQLCVGLEYLHNRQILHRDIKALNIFLSGDDNVRIGDMGVAKIMNNTAAFAQTQVGSPYYLSPELCEEKPYNNKSDVWALGCVLYEMCTGKHPFTAPNQAALILRIVKGTYAPLSFEFSANLREIIDLCLEKDLKKRPTVQSLLLKPEVEGKIEEFGVFVPVGSVIYKQKKSFDTFEAGVKNVAGEKKGISAIKIVSDVQKQIFENRRIVTQQSVKSRPVSASKPEISRFESPTKSKLIVPVKIPVNLFSKNEIKPNIEIPEVQSAHRIEKVIHKPKQSLNEMLEKIQSSQIQPYFAARNMSPFKAEIKISKTPAIKQEKESKFKNDRQNSRLAFKPSTNIYEIKQIYKQKIPASSKITKFEGSLEDIKLVQNLPEYPTSKTKLSVKYLQESSPVRQVNPQSSTKKQFGMLLRPLIDPVYKTENNFFSCDEDDWTILKNKEKESVKNEESLRKQCSKLRSEVIKMIGGDKFNEMHGIFTSIIMVSGI